MSEVKPFEEYKEEIKDISKENMIKGLYDLSKNIIEKSEEIERLNNIIKEVREYIEALKIEDYDSNAYFIQDKYDKWLGIEEIPNKLLEILDKVEENK